MPRLEPRHERLARCNLVNSHRRRWAGSSTADAATRSCGRRRTLPGEQARRHKASDFNGLRPLRTLMTLRTLFFLSSRVGEEGTRKAEVGDGRAEPNRKAIAGNFKG